MQEAVPVMDPLVLIAGCNDAVLADFVAHVRKQRTDRLIVISSPRLCRCVEGDAAACVVDDFTPDGFLSEHADDQVAAVVVFLSRRWTERQTSLLDAVAEIARTKRVRNVCVVSSFLVHFGDPRAEQAEACALKRLAAPGAAVTVVRPSHILCERSRACTALRRLAWCHPLVPKRLTSCCVVGHELFHVIERAIDSAAPHRFRTFTVLGPNRPWADILRDHLGRSLGRRIAAAAAAALSWFFIGHVLGLGLAGLAKFFPRVQSWDFDTLSPASARELLALYNPFNYRDVKVVGYNNGVVHFGQQHPGKTVVSTARCGRVARVHGWVGRFDAGMTIRQATDMLNAAGKEFYVVPNYSFVSLGTTFFVPIHGSASELSTMGDTIERVFLYNPADNRFITAARGSPDFNQQIYNQQSDVLLLRLSFRVKDKTRYFMTRETLTAPTSGELLAAFHDREPSNVEIRKSKAASPFAEVCKYYTDRRQGHVESLEVPRDRLGRLWDWIECNPPAAALFHGLMRRFGYHVELFLAPDEFAVFWDTHRRLPIAKIQLRYIKRDRFPHSPFRGGDCVAADLFMLRKHKEAFDRYVQETIPAVRFNPGKHSM
jgi:hypothetical protein